MNISLLRREGQSGEQRGAALVIILALIVLLTGIVAIFLFRTLSEEKVSSSSANEARVDIMARSAIDMVTGDLKQEIATGSSTYLATNSAGTFTNTLYFPLSATNMVPQRIGIATNSAGVDMAPNLVRRSIRSDPLPVPSRASAVNSSTDASYNGRSISLARWNSHYLIPRLNAGNTAIDSTPIASFTAPDWVMVTTSGPKVLTTPDQTTIGRYAYAIYDEGGLLDANVAGYPSSIVLSPPSTQTIDGTAATINGKGSMALADLTALSDTNSTPLWTVTAANINSLVGWRNYATIQPTGSLGSYTFSPPTGTNYFNYITTTTNGFLTVNPVQYNSRTDQAFTSRQALLKFQRATGFPQDALQYLGTFSRDLEQPSFRPDPTRPKGTHPLKLPLDGSAGTSLWYGGNDAYYATPPSQTPAAHQDDINPSLLTVLNSSGQPVMRRRFPLSRLAYVVGNPPAANAALIKQYFGLAWDTPNSRWIYTSPDATTAQSGIKTLAQVAAVSPAREPDFFETLKAVINCDSLGKQMGSADGYNSDTTFTYDSAAVDGRVDYQIWQIGANIIDQYDADSYPTRIGIADKVATNAGSGSTWSQPYDNTITYANRNLTHYPREIYGTEDVPYMLGWSQSWYRTQQLTTNNIASSYRPPGGLSVYTGTQTSPNGAVPSFGTNVFYEEKVLVQPILWNPHAPGSNPQYSGASGYPASFQVAMGNSQSDGVAVTSTPAVQHTWWLGYTTNTTSYPAAPSGLTPLSYATASIGPINANSTVNAVSYLQFKTSASGPANFREPYRLNAPNYPAGSATTADSTDIINTIDTEIDSVEHPTALSQALGFYAGTAWTGPVFTTSGKKYPYLDEGDLSGTASTYRIHLEYQNPYASTPPYLTYDVISNPYLGTSSANRLSLVASDDNVNSIRGFNNGFRVDPRTNRWGEGNNAVCPYWDNRTASPGPYSMWDGVSTLPSWISGDVHTYDVYQPIYFPQGQTIAPGIAPLITPNLQDAIKPWASGWQHGGSSNGQFFPGDLVRNSNTPLTPSSIYAPGLSTGLQNYYADPDGVVRRASGGYYNTTTGDGLPLTTGNYTSRPIILNRPFVSIAELGYTFRGEPWKNIDFFTPESGDAALLDAFCLNELQNAPTNVTVAGRVNLNTRQSKVLQALVQGVSKAEGGVITTTEAQNAAQALVNWTTADPTLAANQTAGIFNKGPLRNRSELVGKFVSPVSFTPGGSYEQNPSSPTALGTLLPNTYFDGSLSYSGYSSLLTSTGTNAVFSPATSQPDSHDAAAIQRRRECVIRALGDSGNARTWNLLIDVIAQTGRYPAGATALSQFIVTGETRYWVHVAIDRYTGTIIAESFEPVTE